jgi:hypothetical protein
MAAAAAGFRLPCPLCLPAFCVPRSRRRVRRLQAWSPEFKSNDFRACREVPLYEAPDGNLMNYCTGEACNAWSLLYIQP